MEQIEINALSSYVRLALRIYFTIILLLVAYVGDQCCAMRVRLRLHRRQVVRLQQMTGWLTGTPLVSAIASLRALPASWLGAFMLLVAILNFACDLAVSGLVVPRQVVGRCHFNTSGIYATLSDNDFNTYMGVVGAGPMYDLVVGAQATSQRNGGIDGIYQKVNSDLDFRADRGDIVGQWMCTPTGEERTFPASYDTTKEMNNIQDTLVRDGLLFGETYIAAWDNTLGPTRGYFAWSAPVKEDFSHEPWTVRAAAQVSLNELEPKRIKLYSCAMAAPSLEWLLPLIEVPSLIGSWYWNVQANMYPMYQVVANRSSYSEFDFDPPKVIASKLNAAMMIAGQSWGIKASPRTIDDPTQGCLALRTVVPWSVAGLVVLALLLFLGLAAYLFVLHLLVCSAQKSNSPGYAREIKESTPNDLIGWMRQATEETTQGPPKTSKPGAWTPGWHFGALHSGRVKMGLMYSAASGEQLQPLSYSKQTGFSEHECSSEA